MMMYCDHDPCYRARDVSSPGLRSEVMTMKGQVTGLEEVVRRVSLVTESMVERAGQEVGDWGSLARELGNLSNNSIFR